MGLYNFYGPLRNKIKIMYFSQREQSPIPLTAIRTSKGQHQWLKVAETIYAIMYSKKPFAQKAQRCRRVG